MKAALTGLCLLLMASNANASSHKEPQNQCRHNECESTAWWWRTDDSKRDPRWYNRKEKEED